MKEEEKTLSEEALSYGWRQAKSRFGLFFIYLVAIGLILMGFLGATAGLALVESAR